VIGGGVLVAQANDHVVRPEGAISGCIRVQVQEDELVALFEKLLQPLGEETVHGVSNKAASIFPALDRKVHDDAMLLARPARDTCRFTRAAPTERAEKGEERGRQRGRAGIHAGTQEGATSSEQHAHTWR
jgi:hypothetical protein